MRGNYAMLDNLFQSTLPVWGATCGRWTPMISSTISIHAPRVGSDLHSLVWEVLQHISIHAPRVGSDSCRVTPMET